MKKYFIFIIVIALIIFSLVKTKASVEKGYIYEYFDEYRTCIKCEEIYSISNREFILIETSPSGYLIIDKETGKVLEGCMVENSLFYNRDYEEAYYNGYNKYYYESGSLIYNLLDNSLMETEYLINEAKWLDDRIVNTQLNYSNDLSYTYIQNSDYFAPTLKHPINEYGTCGQVALAILLGYLDLFYNSYIVPDYLIDDGIMYMITKKSNLEYIDNLAELDVSIFDNYGTADKLQDILLSYGHYLYHDENGYPTTSLGLSNVFENYMRDFIPTEYFYSFRVYCANVFETLQVIKNLINENLPVIMTMIEYDYGYSENSVNHHGTFHNVIAYGYKNDVFICHSGWGGNPEDNNYHRVLFNSIWLESYLAIDYVGEHVHSDNLLYYINNCSGSWCPCGYINCNHESSTMILMNDNQFHNILCDACNSVVSYSLHNFTYNNNYLICSECGFSTHECNHYYIYNSYTSGRHYLKCALCSELKSEAHFLVNKRGIYYCIKCPYSSSSGIGVLD